MSASRATRTTTEDLSGPVGAPAGRVLLVGAVTWDVFGGERRAGGAVSFAARSAAALGVRARILVIAGADADLGAFDGHEVHVIASQSTLTFEHDVHGDQRRLRVLARPERTRTATDIPRGWLDSQAVLLGPLLADDVDVPSFVGVGSGRVGLLGQGLQRVVGGDGVVGTVEGPSASLLSAVSPRCSLFLSEGECSSWGVGDRARVVEGCERVVVTRGAAGAEVWRAGERALHVAAAAAKVVDPTGAGDVFATAFFLGVSVLGLGDAEAGLLASRLAAAKVERVGAVALPRL